MRSCAVHRVRYRRLWRLPSLRAFAVALPVTLALVATATALGPMWLMPAVVPLAALAVTLGRQRDRVALELHMLRALWRSRCGCPGDAAIPGLSADVRAKTRPDGVTAIDAGSWLDAIRALGLVTARDRGYQLERLRRMAAGRLAETWGWPALPIDAGYRPLALVAAAERALASLEPQERALLEAFAAGVNALWEHEGPPFECRFLSYRPEPWAPADSLAIALLLYHGLSWNEPAKRAEQVMQRALPDAVARFLLGAETDPPAAGDRAPADDLVAVDPVVAGSNCWVQRAPEGPLLACDLHMPLSVPNVLYEVDLAAPGRRVRGLMVAGLPVVLTGSNGKLVWGVTNLAGDVLDLVPTGGETTRATERIAVRGRGEVAVDVRRAGALPVSPRPLLGEEIALRWTGFDPRSCDLRFQRLAGAAGVAEAMAILDGAHGIALNVLVADAAGRMAHLATGLLPRRVHGDGEPGTGDAGDGYLTGAERPRLVDPPDGILVSANDAALPEERFRISYDVDPGHRARRVRSMLAEPRVADAAATRAMQHDVRAELYLPYRDLAVAALRGRDPHGVAAILAGWDGSAAVDSVAFGILVRLRERLARRVISAYLPACRDHDPGFRYAFQVVDRPLLAILRSRDPALLPAGEEAWDGFIARCAGEVVFELMTRGTLPAWGQLNRVGLRHPLEDLAPWARSLLGVAARPQAGALHCVRTCVRGFSSVGRAVLRPGPVDAAEFETPGGQSGHPLSLHYDDRHREWSDGRRPGRPRQEECKFVLRAPSAG